MLNLLGMGLFFSWSVCRYGGDMQGFWPVIDQNVFFFFNGWLGENLAFRYVVAFTNLRVFDTISFLSMLAIFGWHYRKMDKAGRRWMLCMGVVILLTAVIGKQFDLAWNVERPSPTMFFTDLGTPVLRVSELTGWPAKDWSSSSFPGDHGMCLLIFCFYMLRYFGWRTFMAGLMVVVLFSLPRVMSGAHWFTDIAVGAASVNLIVLSWMLLTPASDKIIAWLMKKMHWQMLS
ncbi:PAP2 superfamily protein [Selenomonas ruminantium]|uniref:PAP2 superfamily protein n=2 Tax=Selenomonas ruminantium TaxID=971 RepID=A0A1M6SJL4_SELRU|nr:PAP2 superfamily protein [Selenomonas ruminantium]